MSKLLDDVKQALNETLPAMTIDGGGAEIISLEGSVVTIRLLGSCNFCPSRQLSASALIRRIQERFPEIIVDVIYTSLPSLCNQLLTIEKDDVSVE